LNCGTNRFEETQRIQKIEIEDFFYEKTHNVSALGEVFVRYVVRELSCIVRQRFIARASSAFFRHITRMSAVAAAN